MRLSRRLGLATLKAGVHGKTAHPNGFLHCVSRLDRDVLRIDDAGEIRLSWRRKLALVTRRWNIMMDWTLVGRCGHYWVASVGLQRIEPSTLGEVDLDAGGTLAPVARLGRFVILFRGSVAVQLSSEWNVEMCVYFT